MNPLPAAANDGEMRLVSSLLKQPQITQADKDLALGRACCNGFLQVAGLLLEYGADPNGQYETAPGEFNYGPIILAACEFLNAEGLEWLLENGANPNGNPNGSSHFQDKTPLEMVRDTYVQNEDHRKRCIELLVAAGGQLPEGMHDPTG